MRRHRRVSSSRAFVVAVVCVLGALLVASCSDGDSPDARLTSTPAEAAPSPTATPQGGGALPLESYQYLATVKVKERGPRGKGKEVVFTTWGLYQAPDRHSFTYALKLGGEKPIVHRAVIIGDEAWMRTNKKEWQEVPADDPELESLLATAFTSKRPDFLGGPGFEEVRESARRLPSQEDAVNGVPADHYQVGTAGWEFMDSFLAEERGSGAVSDFNWELWLAKDGGWPVRLVATAKVQRNMPVVNVLGLTAPADWQFRIEVSQPNDPSLVITPPLRGA